MNASEELRYLILAAQREGGRLLAAALRPYGLTPAQAEAIDALRQAGRPLTVREIGDRLIGEHGSPSRLMSTLVRKGLVEPSGDERDRRVRLLALTAEGREAAARMTAVKRRIDRAMAPVLDRHDADAAIALLRALVADGVSGRALARRIEDARRR